MRQDGPLRRALDDRHLSRHRPRPALCRVGSVFPVPLSEAAEAPTAKRAGTGAKPSISDDPGCPWRHARDGVAGSIRFRSGCSSRPRPIAPPPRKLVRSVLMARRRVWQRWITAGIAAEAWLMCANDHPMGHASQPRLRRCGAGAGLADPKGTAPRYLSDHFTNQDPVLGHPAGNTPSRRQGVAEAARSRDHPSATSRSCGVRLPRVIAEKNGPQARRLALETARRILVSKGGCDRSDHLGQVGIIPLKFSASPFGRRDITKCRTTYAGASKPAYSNRLFCDLNVSRQESPNELVQIIFTVVSMSAFGFVFGCVFPHRRCEIV